MLKNRAARFLLTTSLILGSGAFAWWQNVLQPAPLPASRAARHPLQMRLPPPAAPQPDSVASLPQSAPPQFAPQKITPQPIAPPTIAPQPDAAPLAEAAPPETPAPPPAPAGRYADGDFTGDAIDTYWGVVQLKAIIRGGAIVDVDVFAYPDHRSRSIRINEYAVPELRREAIQQQTALVDIVTEASATTDGFQQSLASALAQAHR